MAYIEKIYDLGSSREYEYCFSGKYGKKGEKRSKRQRASPDQIQKQNQWSRKKRLRRIVEYNFHEGDILVTLKYPRGIRPQMEQVEKDFKNFCNKMRRAYAKEGIPFKYVYRMEIGKRGGIHIHILMNDIPNAIGLLRSKWNGHANVEAVYDLTNGEVSDYLSKLPDDIIEGQMTFLTDAEKKKLIRYGRSRNLVEPQPEVKEYSRRTVEKMVRDGIKPSPGYYIDKSSIWYGTNPFTGYTHLHYKELKTKSEKGTAEVPYWKEEPPWL